jgi:hypothetical protein
MVFLELAAYVTHTSQMGTGAGTMGMCGSKVHVVCVGNGLGVF